MSVHRGLTLCLGLTLLLAYPAAAAEADLAIAPVRASSNVFGDREVEYSFRVSAKKALRGRLMWNYKIGLATVAARDAELSVDPEKPAEIVFKLPVPPVKDGVIVASRLSLAAFEGKGNPPAAEFGLDIWIFPTDPFVGRVEWLKSLKLHLYDPPQSTAKVMTALNVPYEEIQNPAAIADLAEGVLIVGEGVSFKDVPGLGEVLLGRAAAGVTVLCLAPADGSLPVPDGAGWKSLSFIRDVTRTLDKRLEATLPARTLKLKPEADALTAEVADNGWPWAEARTPGSGRWAFCGYPIVARWNDSPTPRYMFTRILERLTDTNPPVESK